MEPSTPPLYTDFLPDDHEYLTYLKKVLRHRCRQSGFRRITPSLIENIEKYEEALGERKEDILKFACTVNFSEGKKVGIIRFDPVLSVARAFVENNMKDWPQPVELYYMDTYLKKDSLGEILNEFNFGIQVIGTSDPAITAQVIYLANKVLDDLGLRELYTVQINHIGSIESRQLYVEDLRNFYFDKTRSLCDKCVNRNENGAFFQLLRCDEEDCSILAHLAPKLENYLSREDKDQFKHLTDYLKELRVGYIENKNLFGDENYNAQTIFEFWHNSKGSKSPVFIGGSNDDMIEKMGGDKVNMMGFSSNTMNLIGDMKEAGIRVPHKDHIQIFVAQLGISAKKKALSLLQRLREAGIQTVGAMGTGSMRTQLDMASEFKVKYTLLMGEVEVRDGMVIIRDMDTGTQESAPYRCIVETMQERIGSEKMDVMEDNEKSVDLK